MSDGTKADDIALALEEAIVSGEIPPGQHAAPGASLRAVPGEPHARARGAAPARRARARHASSRTAACASGMLSRDEIREAFMVRAELESLATEIATPKMTDDDLAELERAERRFSVATQRTRRDEPRRSPGPRGRARLAPPEPLVPRRDLPGRRGPAHRADGEGGAPHVPREAGLGDRAPTSTSCT